jgi:hypothetical protein
MLALPFQKESLQMAIAARLKLSVRQIPARLSTLKSE